MKKALVQLDGRVAQVEPINLDPDSGGIPFPVHDDLKWIDCADNVVADLWRYDGANFVPPAPPPAPGPDVAGFVQDAKAALGGIAQMADVLGPSAALAYQALQLGQWDDCSTLIAAAKAKGTMSAAQYTGLQQLAAKHRVPLILP